MREPAGDAPGAQQHEPGLDTQPVGVRERGEGEVGARRIAGGFADDVDQRTQARQARGPRTRLGELAQQQRRTRVATSRR
jgi:hypothetical protein